MNTIMAEGIIRISRTAGRKGAEFASPEVQREKMEEACATNGWTLRSVHTELDVSGGAALKDRPGMRPAVQAIESGDAQVIIAANGDRLFRDVETERVTVRRIESAGGRVYACDRGFISTLKAADLLNMTLIGAMNENQRLVVKEKTAEGRAKAISRTALPIRTPYGYRRNDLKQLVPDPDLAPLVVRAFELRATGVSVEKIRVTISFPPAVGRKGPPGAATIRDWFVWSGYKGTVEYDGQIFDIPALVSPSLWRAAAARAGQRSTTERVSGASDLLLARLRVLNCGTCGRPMQAQMQQQGRYGTYSCRGGLECATPAAVSSRIAEDVIHAAMKTYLRGVVGRAGGPESAQAARAAAEEARDDLDSYLALLSPRAAALPQTRARAAELEAELNRLELEADTAEDLAEITLPVAEEWGELPRERQRQHIAAMITATVYPGRGADRIHVFPKLDSPPLFIGEPEPYAGGVKITASFPVPVAVQQAANDAASDLS